MDLSIIFFIFFFFCMVTLGWSRFQSPAIYSNVLCANGTDNKDAAINIFNVIDFGAVGDEIADDTNAFMKAWEAVCEAASENPTLKIPPGKTFLLKPINLEGPCNSANLHVEVLGNIVAPSQLSYWKGLDMGAWLTFSKVNGLVIDGNGQIDGQGHNWWQSCTTMMNCTRPTALVFSGCSNFRLSGLKHINSQRNHISVNGCINATISDLNISAPGTSPNTDGIDMAHSSNIQINNVSIGTGDDCIAINSGCFYINITGVACGPGHGISVGSLGKNGEHAEVEEIHVRNCSFNATQNGVRIKTWQGGSGYARRISFQDIKLNASGNPIIIDQFYCPRETCNSRTPAVRVSNVSFTGIHGTSVTDSAITLNCSDSIGCSNIVLNHINITSADPKGVVSSSCNNAHGSYNDSRPAISCLLP